MVISTRILSSHTVVILITGRASRHTLRHTVGTRYLLRLFESKYQRRSPGTAPHLFESKYQRRSPGNGATSFWKQVPVDTLQETAPRLFGSKYQSTLSRKRRHIFSEASTSRRSPGNGATSFRKQVPVDASACCCMVPHPCCCTQYPLEQCQPTKMNSSTAAFPIFVAGLCSACKEEECFCYSVTGKEGEVVFCHRHKIYLDLQCLVEDILNHLASTVLDR